MKTWFAFFKKEWVEQIRSGRLLILIFIFTLFGIMNPAIAKLTPWMMELMEDSLEETGLIVSEIEVDALTSWTQFFKNIPMGLIAFVIIFSNIFTKEYQSGSLILVLTKGFSRYKVIFTKAAMMILLWTGGYWICYGITFGYNAFFWDNSIVKNFLFAAGCWWIFGIMVIGLVVLFSVLVSTNTGVLAGTGSVTLIFYLAGMFPKLSTYMPTKLMETASLLTGVVETGDYHNALGVAIILALICIFVSIPFINGKNI